MARHTKKQIEKVKKQEQKNTMLQKIISVLGIVVAIFAVVAIAYQISFQRQYNKLAQHCDELSYIVDTNVCKQALKCSVDKVGLKKVIQFDEEKLEGAEEHRVAVTIMKCTWQAMVEEIQ